MLPSHSMTFHRARWLVAALRVKAALLRSRLSLRAYHPDQPRVPAGNPDGGQWTNEDGSGSRSRRDDGRILLVSDEGDGRNTVVLAEEEARGGHTLRRHVGKTDDQMLDRVRSSKSISTFYTYGLRRDGSFDPVESANNFVNRTLEQNSSEVDLVASGKETDALITHRFGHKTGREAYTAGHSEPYMRNTYSVGIFIVHDPNVSHGFLVRSAYHRNDGD